MQNDDSTNQVNISPEDYNECLIVAVQARPGLYDHTIPVKDRTTLKKKALWKEVLNILGVTFITFIRTTQNFSIFSYLFFFCDDQIYSDIKLFYILINN